MRRSKGEVYVSRGGEQRKRDGEEYSLLSLLL